MPGIDIILGLPWIKKINPNDFMTPRNFSSGYCARNCNHSTRTRHPKKKTIIKDPVVCLENSRLKKEREESILDNEVLDKYIFDKESNDSESKIQIFNSLVDNDNENEYDIDVISISNSDYEIVKVIMIMITYLIVIKGEKIAMYSFS